MAKIFKSARKLHKTAQEKYRDGLKNFYQSIKDGEWSVKTIKYDRRKIEKQWQAMGGKRKDLYRFGLAKAERLFKARTEQS